MCNSPTKNTTAYHEAGHAAMCIIRGIPFNFVSIAETGDRLGVCQENLAMIQLYMNLGNQSPRLRSMASDSILVTLAGPASEEMLTGVYNEDGAYSDMQRAHTIAFYYSRAPDDYIKRKSREAKNIIRQNWGMVQNIANLLLQHQELQQEALFNFLGIGE